MRRRLPIRSIQFEANELALRARLLRAVLLSTTLGASLWLLINLAGVARSRLFPWDALCVLAACVVGTVLLRWQRFSFQWHVALAGSLFISIASQPLFYAGQFYGISHPANALLVLGLIVAGLLFGYWFTLFWTAMYCGWIVLVAVGEVNGWSSPPNAIHTVSDIAPWVVFWWVVFGATGWLTRLFSSNLERVLAVSREQTAALASTLRTLTTESNPETALDQVLQAAADQLGARWATLFLLDDGLLHAHRAYGDGTIIFGAALDQVAVPPTPVHQSALWQAAVRTRRPVVVNDISNDPRIIHRARLVADGVQTILIVPLVLNDDVIGSLHCNSTTRRRYRSEELDLALALAQQITLALQLQRLAAQTEQSAVINERNRMAREMHDTLAQGFTGIVVQLEAADDALDDAPDTARTHLDRARTLAKTSLTEARRAVWALRPHLLEARDLPSALRAATLAITDGTALRVDFDLPTVAPPLRPDAQAELLRVGQEAITNVVKHAGAHSVSVSLAQQNGHVQLAVADDGRGFDPAHVTPHTNGGVGLIGMHERIVRLGGRLDIRSTPGSGTAITATVPKHEPST